LNGEVAQSRKVERIKVSERLDRLAEALQHFQVVRGIGWPWKAKKALRAFSIACWV
jgi:hypothetical protein